MEELNSTFNEYINELKKTDIKTKRKELIDNIKEMIYIFDIIAKKDNINVQYLKSKEILDLQNENISEDDFLEGAIVYLEVAKNIIGEYMNAKF